MNILVPEGEVISLWSLAVRVGGWALLKTWSSIVRLSLLCRRQSDSSERGPGAMEHLWNRWKWDQHPGCQTTHFCPGSWAAVGLACDKAFSSRESCVSRAVTWAGAKTRAQQHPGDDRTAAWDTGSEAEWGKFLESHRITLCTPPTRWNWEIQMYYLCLRLRIKAIYKGKKRFLGCFFV